MTEYRRTLKTVNRKGRIYMLEIVHRLNRLNYAVSTYQDGQWNPLMETGLYHKALEAIV